MDTIWWILPYPNDSSSSAVYYGNGDNTYIKANMTYDKVMELIVRCRQLREEYEDFRSKRFK